MLKTLRLTPALLATLTQAAVVGQENGLERAAEIEEIVITGRLPGPPLWKITNGEHVLWIFPFVNLYPKKMEWESTKVEKLIAETQEFISMPRAMHLATVSMNPINLVRLPGLMRKGEHPADGKSLAESLPPEIYQRFENLKAQSAYVRSSESGCGHLRQGRCRAHELLSSVARGGGASRRCRTRSLAVGQRSAGNSRDPAAHRRDDRYCEPAGAA